jgi:hypothetical protein
MVINLYEHYKLYFEKPNDIIGERLSKNIIDIK